LSTVNDVVDDRAELSPREHKRWRWVIWIALIAAVVLLVVGEVMLKRAEPILKGRVIETLSTRFNSRVELDDLQVSSRVWLSQGRGCGYTPRTMWWPRGRRSRYSWCGNSSFTPG
jgi:hypothetical protein